MGGSRHPPLPPRKPNETIEDEMYERRRQQELRKQIQEKERELETLSNNKDRLRMRQSSRGSQGGRSNGGLQNGPSDELLRSGNSKGSASNFRREPSARSGSYKRDSNSPLRQRDGSRDAYAMSRNQPQYSVNEFDQKARDRTPPQRLSQEPVRDYPTHQAAAAFTQSSAQ